MSAIRCPVSAGSSSAALRARRFFGSSSARPSGRVLLKQPVGRAARATNPGFSRISVVAMSSDSLQRELATLTAARDKAASAVDDITSRIAAAESRTDELSYKGDKTPAEQHEMLSLHREIRELKSDKIKAQQRLDELAGRVANAEARQPGGSVAASSYSTPATSSYASTPAAVPKTFGSAEEELAALREEVMSLHREMNQVKAEKEAAEAKAGNLSSRIDNVQARAGQYTSGSDLAAAQAELAEKDKEIKAVREEMRALHRELRDSNNEKERAISRMDDLASRISNAQARAAWYTEELAKRDVELEHEKTVSAAKDAEIKAAGQQMLGMHRELRVVKTERDTANKRADELATRIANAQARAQWYTSELEKQTAKLEAEKASSASKDAQVTAANEQAMELNRKLRTLRTEKDEAIDRANDLARRIQNAEARTQWYTKELASGNGDYAQKAIMDEKDEQIRALQERLSSVDSMMEGEQDKAMKGGQVMDALKRELEMMAADKAKADDRVNELTAKIADVESRAEWYTKELQSEREQREDATTAVMKLQEVITDVTGEMEEATHAAGSAHKELGVERKARMEAEEAVITLRSQLESMQSVMQNFRSEMAVMKERSQQALSSVQEKRDDIDKLHQEIAALEEAQGSS